MRRLGCRPTHQACRSQAPWQRDTLSATTWKEGPSHITPTLLSSQLGQLLQLQPLPSPAWPRHPTTALLHPWPLLSAWALSWAQLPCSVTRPSLGPILAGKPPPYMDLPWSLLFFLHVFQPGSTNLYTCRTPHPSLYFSLNDCNFGVKPVYRKTHRSNRIYNKLPLAHHVTLMTDSDCNPQPHCSHGACAVVPQCQILNMFQC